MNKKIKEIWENLGKWEKSIQKRGLFQDFLIYDLNLLGKFSRITMLKRFE